MCDDDITSFDQQLNFISGPNCPAISGWFFRISKVVSNCDENQVRPSQLNYMLHGCKRVSFCGNLILPYKAYLLPQLIQVWFGEA